MRRSMEAAMKFARHLTVLALPLLLLAGTPAAAEQTTAPQGSREAEIGTGLVCDTQEQVERFISLYDGDTAGTVEKVNDAEGNPTACGVATMAYVRGRTLGTARHKDTAFHIVPILVLGVVTESGVASVTPAEFFSAIEIEEIGI
jgi:hypothetical protein